MTELLDGIKDIVKSTKKLPLIRLNLTVKNLITRCIQLFFFYQETDPSQKLSLHDFGYLNYEKVGLEQNQEEIDVNKLMEPSSRDAIFTSRISWIEFDCLRYFKVIVLE